MMIVSAGLVAVILVNAYIIWYFIIGMPAECAARAVATAGRETCGTGPAVPDGCATLTDRRPNVGNQKFKTDDCCFQIAGRAHSRRKTSGIHP